MARKRANEAERIDVTEQAASNRKAATGQDKAPQIDPSQEQIQTLDPTAATAIPEADLDPGESTHPLKDGGHVAGSALRPEDVAKNEAVAKEKPIRRFRVVQGGVVLTNGYRTRLHVGKEIDDRNYDIRRLCLQGVRLEEITGQDPNAIHIPTGY